MTQPTIKISLTQEQAEVLATILSMIGGDPVHSARKQADDITEELAKNKVFSSFALERKYPTEYERYAIYFDNTVIQSN